MLSRTSHFLIVISLLVVILYYGQSIIIPFIFALLLWFTVRILSSLTDKVGFFKKYLPKWIKKLISTAILFFAITFFAQVVISSVNTITKSHHNYDENIELIIEKINIQFGIDTKSWVDNNIKNIEVGQLIKSFLDALSSIVGNAFMIMLFAIFIFIEETNFQSKIKQLIERSPDRFSKLNATLSKIEWSIARYLGIKTIVSLLTGILSFIILKIVGVHYAVFWAFLIFLLNFIPTIGSLLATVFPAVFCLLQFGEFTQCLMVFFIVGSIQVFIGNVLEPKWMGNSMNISPLIAIIALVFWGAIWGTTGMILSIPITVILIIVCSQFQSTKPIAMLLSEKGKI
ncbi:MAG: AI-2E family transporter [Flavobacteriales bacterium]|nr:AI-2E family transporter [Flavobacteriales bacterium]